MKQELLFGNCFEILVYHAVLQCTLILFITFDYHVNLHPGWKKLAIKPIGYQAINFNRFTICIIWYSIQ